MEKIAVTSRSFSKNPILRKELLEKYSNVTFNDDGLSLHGKNLINYLSGHTKAITALEVIDAKILAQLPDLKVISKYGVGLDMIDMAALKEYNIKFGWKGGVNKRSVSELVIAFAITMLHRVHAANIEVKNGIWRQHIGGLLTGKTVGIIGCGYIGKDVAGLMKAFNCNVLANDILDFPEFYKQNEINPVSLEYLLKNSDVVTIHTPLDESTRNILNEERLGLMKPDSVLINLARGGLVDEIKLKKMLQNSDISGAAFDVFFNEPPEDQELISLPNFLATPHIGGSAKEAILAMGRAAIKGLEVEDD